MKRLFWGVTIVVIAFAIVFFAIKIFTFSSQQNTIQSSNEKALLKKLADLNKKLNDSIDAIKNKDDSAFENSFKIYEEQFNKFISESSVTMNDLDDSALTDLREKEWKNYNLLLELSKETESNFRFKEWVNNAKITFENRLTEEFLIAIEKFIYDPDPDQLNYKRGGLLATVADFLINSIKHDVSLRKNGIKTILHKKVVSEWVEDGNKSYYEVWINLETGDIRQELETNYGKEINVLNGKTQKKLALDVNNKLAEWINEGSLKVGIMSEGTDDSQTQFKNKLRNKECYLDGVDVIAENPIYVLKCPIYDLDYHLYHILADSHLPLREMFFREKIISEPEIFKTGEIEFFQDSWFIIAEVVSEEDLPDNFFDQKIPDDYKIEDWVPIG
ncbi:MAG: hypothetical protein Q8N88_00945 [Nanoarchaeota archaeon]|nr:hypothetical protein [Nanoarchaeota archaeon]